MRINLDEEFTVLNEILGEQEEEGDNQLKTAHTKILSRFNEIKEDYKSLKTAGIEQDSAIGEMVKDLNSKTCLQLQHLKIERKKGQNKLKEIVEQTVQKANQLI